MTADDLSRPLWALTQSLVTQDSAQSAEATETFFRSDPEALIIAAVNEIISASVSCGATLGKNPACLATALLAKEEGGIPEEGKSLLAGAANALVDADTTNESRTPHITCYPWPAEIEQPSIDSAQSARLLEELLVILPAVQEDERPLTVGLAFGAAEVLAAVTFAEVDSNFEAFRELLDAKATR